MRIIFVRHGHPDYRKDCLTEAGHLHARAAAERLAHEPIRRICSSTCGRAAETAAHIAEKFGLPVEQYDFIREISWGSVDGTPLPFNGHPWQTIDQMVADGKSLMNEQWMNEGTFPNNQVVHYVRKVSEGIDQWISSLGYDRAGDFYRVRSANDDTVVMTSHAGSSSAALAHMFNLTFPFVIEAIPPGYTAITIVTLQGEEGSLISPKIEIMNDARHIENIAVQNIFGK